MCFRGGASFTGWLLIVAGGVVGTVGVLGRSGRLPRNRLVGIRLRSTMTSDEAWAAAHRASWLYTLSAGIVMALFGIARSVNPHDAPSAWMFLAVVVVPLLAGGVSAHRAARAIDSRAGGNAQTPPRA